jgi:nucleotide-binding universal stress UspA family protein
MFNAILYPVDGSAISFKPLQSVIDLAKLSNSKIVVLSIAEPRLFHASDRESRETGQAVENMHLDIARENVQKVCAAAEQAGVHCESRVAMSPVPGDGILEAAQAAQCDLIVMATRGKRGFLEDLFGESTTEEVLSKSPVPMLVFP